MVNDIKPGDLVALVRGHACVLGEVGGIPFEVESVYRTLAPWARFVCNICGHRENAVATRYVVDPRGNTLPLSWLTRFAPLIDIEILEQEVEVLRRYAAAICDDARVKRSPSTRRS